MVTPHLSAGPGEFAPDVLLPGDPKRADLIAGRHLDDARVVSDVRGIRGWTGTVDGRPVSVLASGMGIPSLMIYATELAREYGVRRIVRIGTAGGIAPSVSVGDVVVASSAHTDSGLVHQAPDGVRLSYAADPSLLVAAAAEGVALGPVFSTDFYHSARPGVVDQLRSLGTLAVEMEAAGLYAVGMREGVRTLAVLTVASHTLGGPALDSAARERDADRAVVVALRALAAPHTPANSR